MDIEQIVSDFNCTVQDFATNLAEICPETIIGQNIKHFNKLINLKNNRYKFIEIFISKILQYKDKIDKGDESFFINKQYDTDLDNDKSLINKVFEFQNIWQKLSTKNKEFVIQYMQILCELAQNYFLIKDQ